jgi:hypothetical protein
VELIVLAENRVGHGQRIHRTDSTKRGCMMTFDDPAQVLLIQTHCLAEQPMEPFLFKMAVGC